MKKKIFSLLIALAVVLTTMPAVAFAEDTYTITIDINGGILTSGIPTGWVDIGDGKYTKAFPASAWAYFGDEWKGYEPAKTDYNFGGWLPEGSYFTTGSVFLNENKLVTASYLALLDVIVDLDGGLVDPADVPNGWTLVGGETDKYTKKFKEGDYYSMTILTEWQNVVPTYPAGSNKAFIKWDNPNGYSLAIGDQPIKAQAGELRTVTVDFDGGTVLSADPSWTLVGGTTDKYTKKFPEGYQKMDISSELTSAFSVQNFNGTAFFTNSYSYSWSPSTVSGDDTVFTVTKYPAITITVLPPENGMILIDGELKTSPYDLKVPEGTTGQVLSGIFKLSKNPVIEDIMIEAYGNAGYALDTYALNGAEAASYIPSISSDSTISANLVAGVQNYPIWIGGTQLSSDNLSILDGTVSYDPSTKVLTLDGANIVSNSPAAIYFGTDITLNIASDSSLKCTDAEATRCVLAGVDGTGYSMFNASGSAHNIIVSGNGKLTVELADKTINTNIYAKGILAKNITINTDVDIKCGALTVTNNYSGEFNGIYSNNIVVNDAKLSIMSDTINVDGTMLSCYMVNSPISLNNSELELTMGENILPVYSFAYSEFIGNPYMNKITFNSGKITATAHTSGKAIQLAPGAKMASFSGATDGAAATDLTFTQKDSAEPLVLISKKPVTISGISMTKESYDSDDTVAYTGNPTAIFSDDTDVTDSIDNWNYEYYIEDEMHPGNWTKLETAPEEGGSYKLVVEVSDGDYYGSLELPFTIAHSHSFSYSVNSSNPKQLFATCAGGGVCGYKYEPLTLTLTAPADNELVYTGIAKSVNYADNEATTWHTLTGNTAPTIEYYLADGSTKTNSDNSGASAEGLAPVKVGMYKAKATVDVGKTAILEFNITKAALTVTAENKDIVYGQDASNSGVTYSGFVNSETSAVLDGTLTFAYKDAGTGMEYTSKSAVGAYDIIPGGLTSDNYNITFEKGTLTVNQADQPVVSVIMDNYTYGGTPSIPSLSAIVMEDASVAYYCSTAAVTSGGIEWTDINETSLAAGTYYMYAVVSETTNYKGLVTGTPTEFQVEKKEIVVTAKDKSVYIGDAVPQCGNDDYLVEGLLGSDILITAPAFTFDPMPSMTEATTVAIKLVGADAGKNYSIQYVDGILTINSRPNSGGSSASSTITVPVMGDENTVKASATVSGSTATVKKINDADLEKVTEGESVSIDLSAAGKNVDTAKIPTETVEKIAEKSAMTVKLPVATVEFDKAATEEIADQAKGSNIELVVDDIKEVSLNAVQKESVKKLDTAIIIDAHLASNGKMICSEDNGGFGGGSAKVILPYEIKNNRKPENYSVFYVNEAGKLEKLNAVYDEELKAFVFEIEHFSVYAVAFEQFVDIDANAYYYDAVKWAAANGITDGVDETHFDPSGITNRAQMVTFLWRVAGMPEPTITETPFTDLDPDKYYYKAVLWAYEKGITDGTSATTFEPNKNVSRAQTVTFLWRYAGKPVVDYWMQMTDVASGKYYTEAVRWALAEKITDGTTTSTFSPNDDCLRGQIVTFLYRDFAK